MTDSKNPTNLRLRKIGSVVKDTVWTIKDEQERPLAEIHYGKFSADKYSVRLYHCLLDTFIMADFDNPCELNTLQEAAEVVDAWLHCNAVEYFSNIKHSEASAVAVPPLPKPTGRRADDAPVWGMPADLEDVCRQAGNPVLAAYQAGIRRGHSIAENSARAISANCELGEGMVAVVISDMENIRHLTEKPPRIGMLFGADDRLGACHRIACRALSALRANQGERSC